MVTKRGMYGDGDIKASPPVVAEVAVVDGADVLCHPSPVPLDGRGDEVHDEASYPICEGAPMSGDVPSTAKAPDSPDSDDAEELPKAEEVRVVGTPS